LIIAGFHLRVEIVLLRCLCGGALLLAVSLPFALIIALLLARLIILIVFLLIVFLFQLAGCSSCYSALHRLIETGILLLFGGLDTTAGALVSQDVELEAGKYTYLTGNAFLEI
jgi:hypothetical protein